MKRYRLKIPDMIRKEDALRSTYWGPHDGKSVTPGNAIKDRDIPKDWLEEIKDEPVSADVALRAHCVPETPNNNFNQGFIEGFIKGEENNELRHREKQSFMDWSIKAYPSWNMDKRILHKEAWDAKGRSCNLEISNE